MSLKDELEDVALHCVLRRDLHRMSPRQVAETMMRLPDEKIEAAARKLEAEAAWLRGWKSGSTLPAEGCDSAAAAQSSSETDHV